MPGEYSQVSDLLKGDLILPAVIGTGQRYITLAAEEMDSVLGKMYVTPITITDSPVNRPSLLYLKNTNNFIASGRLILDVAVSREDRQLHAYGASLLAQGQQMLNSLANGTFTLPGSTLIDTDAAPTAPTIHNEDSASLVEAGYAYIHEDNILDWLPPEPARPYE
jgi:hypothetical protein